MSGFDSPDGRTYSEPVSAPTPEQATPPALFARWYRIESPKMTDHEIADMWVLSIPADREFWTETAAALTAAREPHAAPRMILGRCPVHAGKVHMGARLAVVASNQPFTPSAQQLASTTGTLLLHYTELGQLTASNP